MDRNQRKTCQAEFSNYLNLLQAINYEDPALKWSNADGRDNPTKSLLRILETIALCMATGQHGEVVASTFVSPKSKMLLLSKNADPKPQDVEDSETLIKLLQSSSSRDMLDILPFLARRHADVVNKHLTKLVGLMQIYRGDILKRIHTYTVDTPGHLDLYSSEFPQVEKEFFIHYKDAPKSSSTVKRILQDIINTCVAGERFVNNESSFKNFNSVVSAATALGKSRFFKYYIDARKIVKTDNTQLSKLWRNLDKVHQYIRISDTILYMQQNGPFTVKWVTKADLEDAAYFESKISLCSVWTTVTKIIESNKKSNTKQSFNKDDAIAHFKKNMTSFWKEAHMEPRDASTTLHAELRLIVFLEIQAQQSSRGTKSTTRDKVHQHPIGCSKRSCLACTWTMQEINKLTKVIYLTAGSHTGAYRTCARIGPIFHIDPYGKCGERVFERIVEASKKVVAKLSEPPSAGVKGHAYKHSEEYVSSSDPDGEGEPDKSKRKYVFVPK
ncbi:hypothetical protein C0992_003960 [Termitomyces sp. T32_za158]|nr:hypothetical protein C0992_003960 [Termitomyces sp. T32_za158]